MPGPESRGRAVAVGLDLGTTRIKAGWIDRSGSPGRVRWSAAPPLRGTGRIREGDALAYAAAARRLLRRITTGLPAGLPVGIASQRSTFLLWDRETGRPATPLISWQDRRAAAWCDRHAGFAGEFGRRTGLVFTPHLAGPKLAAVLDGDPDLARAARRGALRFGTLETFLLWAWSGGRTHATDLTMAARTGLVDVQTSGWSDRILDLWKIPRTLLPAIRPTVRRGMRLETGVTLTATIADQAAAALAVLPEAGDVAAVNLGTGAFVLREASRFGSLPKGYHFGPILHRRKGGTRYALEGTVNGAGSILDRAGGPPSVLPPTDPAPESFCLPDAAGLGAPHWRADLRFRLSPAAARRNPGDRRRVILEGMLFRIRELLDGLFPGKPPSEVRVSGGLARRRSVVTGLAALLDSRVRVLPEADAALLAAARLAAGIAPRRGTVPRAVHPGDSGLYLEEKFRRWRAWLGSLL
ncbi:MAG: hypothetical protein HY509_06260 [Acidobacteria bacterium]|nr:hypothetical protein [Acidobacteriota bacterium]